MYWCFKMWGRGEKKRKKKRKTPQNKKKNHPNNYDVYAVIIVNTFVALVQLNTAESCSHLSQCCTWILCLWTCWTRKPTCCALLGHPWCLSLSFCHAGPSLTFDGCVCVFEQLTELLRTLPACVSSLTCSRGSIEGQRASLFRLSLCPWSTAVKYIQYIIKYIHIYFLCMHIFMTIFALTPMDRWIYFFPPQKVLLYRRPSPTPICMTCSRRWKRKSKTDLSSLALLLLLLELQSKHCNFVIPTCELWNKTGGLDVWFAGLIIFFVFVFSTGFNLHNDSSNSLTNY